MCSNGWEGEKSAGTRLYVASDQSAAAVCMALVLGQPGEGASEAPRLWHIILLLPLRHLHLPVRLLPYPASWSAAVSVLEVVRDRRCRGAWWWTERFAVGPSSPADAAIGASCLHPRDEGRGCGWTAMRGSPATRRRDFGGTGGSQVVWA